jgi:bilirubin oxidase
LLIPPAARVQLVVDAGAAKGLVSLSNTPYQRGKMGMVPPEDVMQLLRVDFSQVADFTPKPLPTSLRPIAALGRVSAKKRVVFSEQMSMAGGAHSMKFLVNGKHFDMQRIDLKSRAKAVELWEIVNDADMDHPFHIHGTQFQVVDRAFEGKVTPEPFLAWRDIVNLRSGETVRIKLAQPLKGLRMFHCHILEHESAGMMGQLLVV